jgi:hypothetical protein
MRVPSRARYSKAASTAFAGLTAAVVETRSQATLKQTCADDLSASDGIAAMIAAGNKNWLFAGSKVGGECTAAIP